MEVFYLKVNQKIAITWRYLQMWLEIVQQFPSAKTYIISDKPELTKQISALTRKGGYVVEFITSARNSDELKYIVDNAIVSNWRPAAYAHLTTFLHARDNGYENFWNIDADDIGLYAKPRVIAKILTLAKKYATEHAIDIFSFDAGGKTFSLGKNWNFGVSYTINPAKWLEIFKEHCTDDAYTESFNRFGDVKNVDWLMTYLRLANVARLETFYVENLQMGHHHIDVYDIPLWGTRYWTGGRCYWSLMENDFGMGNVASLPIPADTVKFDVGLTLEESKRYLKESAFNHSIIRFFEIANGILDAGITLILPLDGTVDNVRPCLESLLKQTCWNEKLYREVKVLDDGIFSAFRLVVVDAGLSEVALKTCREVEGAFNGRMKILTDVLQEKLLSAGLQAAKGYYVMFINGSDIFVPEALQTLFDAIEDNRADVVHASNYFLLNGNGTATVMTDEQGWGANINVPIKIPRIGDRLNAWFKQMFSPSIYNKLIRRDFLDEEKISLPNAMSLTKYIFSLQCLCLAKKYVRIPQPLYARYTRIKPESLAADSQSTEYSKAAIEKIIDETLYFDEYASAKDFLKNTIAR